ncbi:hypothetical protein ACH5RR_009241 [Cinchona calisaya]|uniref:Uncharacterized protein n=1 Tax=Cinchona calisaya TaxID=153742 RepID=A0ABD3ADU4_9GENT
MSSAANFNFHTIKEKLGLSSQNFVVFSLCKTLLISGLVLSLIFMFFFNNPTCSNSAFFSPFGEKGFSSSNASSVDTTNLQHLAFGIQGSEKTYHFRKPYIEAWWRPNETRGYVYLDKPPTGNLLPWSPKSPPYRINDDISKLIREVKPNNPTMPRMVHGIFELFREEHEGIRWIVMGDDDSIFFVDNLVEVLSKYDYTKYYYIGYPSEYVMSNYWFSFNQAFGGSGIILSYPLAKALVKDMDRCLRTYGRLSADLMTKSCLDDIGVNLTPNKGFHQIDLLGDLSGFLSSHPKDLVLSLHHVDKVHPYFPSMDRAKSAHHLMKAGNVDQSRLFQQTICYHRPKNWSFSIAWGYSAHIYEKTFPRNWLTMPIETFKPWQKGPYQPRYMFNVRRPSGDPCEAPHVFFFESIKKISSHEILTVYSRSAARNLTTCVSSGNYSAEYITKIYALSPATKRTEIHRSECCDVVRVEDMGKADVKLRECMTNEIIA